MPGAEDAMSKAQGLYEQVLNDAIEHVFIAAVRNAMDTRLLEQDSTSAVGPGRMPCIRSRSPYAIATFR